MITKLNKTLYLHLSLGLSLLKNHSGNKHNYETIYKKENLIEQNRYQEPFIGGTLLVRYNLHVITDLIDMVVNAFQYF